MPAVALVVDAGHPYHPGRGRKWLGGNHQYVVASGVLEH